MADDRGVKAAVDQLQGDALPPDPGAGEQIPLLPEAVPPAEAPAAGDDEARGPGRPPGARNRRTEEWVEYLGNKGRLPLEVLHELYNKPLDELKAELGCSSLEAMQERRHAAVAALPYLHQKMPIALDVDQSGVVQLVIDIGGAEDQVAGDGEGALVIEGEIVDSIPNKTEEKQ